MSETCHKSPPRRGEGVYDVARRFAGYQPNGTIVGVDHEDHMVFVTFAGSRAQIGYDFDELAWDDNMGGKWVIGEEAEVNRNNVSRLPLLK